MADLDNSLFAFLIIVVLCLMSLGYSRPKSRSIPLIQLLLSAQVLQRQFNAERGSSWFQYIMYGCASLFLLGVVANGYCVHADLIDEDYFSLSSSLIFTLLILGGLVIQHCLVWVAMSIVQITDASGLFFYSMLLYARLLAFSLLPLVGLMLFGGSDVSLVSLYLALSITGILLSVSSIRTAQLASRMKIRVISVHYLLYLCFMKGVFAAFVLGGFALLF